MSRSQVCSRTKKKQTGCPIKKRKLNLHSQNLPKTPKRHRWTTFSIDSPHRKTLQKLQKNLLQIGLWNCVKNWKWKIFYSWLNFNRSLPEYTKNYYIWVRRRNSTSRSDANLTSWLNLEFLTRFKKKSETKFTHCHIHTIS